MVLSTACVPGPCHFFDVHVAGRLSLFSSNSKQSLSKWKPQRLQCWHLLFDSFLPGFSVNVTDGLCFPLSVMMGVLLPVFGLTFSLFLLLFSFCDLANRAISLFIVSSASFIVFIFFPHRKKVSFIIIFKCCIWLNPI